MSPVFACSVDGRCLSLRLTDGALSADIFPRDYHHVVQHDDRRTGQLLPVKWMAIETLETTNDDRQLSTASDVVRSRPKTPITSHKTHNYHKTKLNT